MKYIPISLIVVFLFLFGDTFASPKSEQGATLPRLNENSSSQMGSGIITGKIEWASDGTPVVGAVVELHLPPDGRGGRIKFVADSTGKYYVDGLEPGIYHVTLPGAVMRGNKATFIFVNDGQFNLQVKNDATTEVNFQVQAGGSISGKVTHQKTGLAIKNAVIRLYHPGGSECFRLRSSTDSKGNYFIGGLDENDEFYLYASGEIGQNVELSHQFAEWDKILDGEYYQESPNLSGAKKVKIIGNQSGFNFTLSGTGIVGFVQRADNKAPVLCTHVMLYNENWDILEQANTDSFNNGFYWFKNVRPGNKYYLEATGWNWVENQQQYLPVFYDRAATRDEAKLLVLREELKEIDFLLSEGIQIKGKVTRQDNGQPIALARVALYDSKWNYLRETNTNNEGIYSVRASAGDYFLEATGWGDFDGEYQKLYKNEFYHESSDQAGALLVHITQDVDSIDFTLEELLCIKGKVTRYLDNAPVRDGQVIAYDENWNFTKETRTDYNGIFNFTGLDSARSYFFEVTGKVWWDFGAYGDWNQLYRAQYYNNTACRDSATLVDLSELIPPLDFILHDFEGYTISGKLIRQDNSAPIGFSGIEIFDSERNNVSFAIASNIGKYTTPRLAKGSYYVVATGYCESNGWRKLYQTEYYPESPDWEGATLLSLDHDLINIDFTLVEGMSISGNVRDFLTGNAIGEAQIFVYDQQWQIAGEGRSNPFGAYSVPVLIAGEYYVEANGKIYMDMGGYGDFVSLYHPAYFDDAYRKEEARLVHVDKNVEGINLTLSDINSYRISGDVRAASDQQPICNMKIQLFDNDWRNVSECLSFPNGHYYLRGIQAGKYYVKATGYCFENDSLVHRFRAVYYPGTSDSSQAKSLIVIEMIDHIDFLLAPYQVAVETKNPATAPESFQLKQNYPNPFNPTTIIQYELPVPGNVRLIIYDLLGRHIKTLVNSQHSTGHFQIAWDGTDEQNLPVAAGLYFCRMESGDFVKVIKLALVK